ncbi:hypothetical protein, partial [Pseudomonas sp. UM16]|uniref:hypothetical protein n=1 Tax=Pseudomonas sp. UM16 TaxID=3158962 RepID=UPI003D077A8F
MRPAPVVVSITATDSALDAMKPPCWVVFFARWLLRSGLWKPKRQNPYLQMQIGVSEFNLDDDLLSH